MRRLETCLAAMLVCLAANAQYYVSEINGEAFVRKGSGWEPAVRTMSVAVSDSLRTSDYSCLVILDRGAGRLYSLQTPQATTLGELIKGQKKQSPSLVGEVVAGIWNAMFGKNEKSMEAYERGSGVTYKDEDDEKTIAQALVGTQRKDANISLRMLDFTTGEPVEEIMVGQTAVAEVTNNTGKPLYFNIADFDSEGNVAPILPFDECQTMLHLYLPPYSVVRLYQFPIEFCEPRGVDRLVLVAYPKPFNLANVLNLMKTAAPSYSPDVYSKTIHMRIR